MDFTREPVVETIITPKEGSKLVVRSSKGSSQEEYFVDAIEVVSFGNAFFFRTLEKPKSFLLPITDYEVLEVREARMIVKHTPGERSVKIGKGKPPEKKKEEPKKQEAGKKADEPRIEKKRERRRNIKNPVIPPPEETVQEQKAKDKRAPIEPPKVKLPDPSKADNETEEVLEKRKRINALLPPPPVLISESITRLRESEEYKDAFFTPNDKKPKEEAPKVEEAAKPEEPKSEAPQEEGSENKKRSFWDFAKELTK